jgi:hypothetical protein
MPLYLFSVVATPKWVLNSIRKNHLTFLWGGDKNTSKWALVKWDKFCLPKSMGGLGLRDHTKINEILSAKTWWNWVSNNSSIWAQL